MRMQGRTGESMARVATNTRAPRRVVGHARGAVLRVFRARISTEQRATWTYCGPRRGTLSCRRCYRTTLRRCAAGETTSVPSKYFALTTAPTRATTDDIARIVEADPAMSVKVLQLVNSAYFGLARRIASIGEAVSYLGVELLKGLSLSAQIFSVAGRGPRHFSIEQMQEESLKTARLAKRFFTERNGRAASPPAVTSGHAGDSARLAKEYGFRRSVVARDGRDTTSKKS